MKEVGKCSAYFSNRSVLSFEILKDLGYYDKFPELAPAPGGKDYLKTDRRQYARGYTWKEAAKFFVKKEPTYKQMMDRFGVSSPSVWRIVNDKNFIKEVRELGYAKDIKLRRKKGSGKGQKSKVKKRHEKIYKEVKRLYCELNAVGISSRDAIKALRVIHKRLGRDTIKSWVDNWEADDE